MANGDLTLTLSGLTQVVNRFTAYSPRIEIQDQRPAIRHTLNLNSVISKVSGEARHIWNFTAIGDVNLYLGLSRLYKKQNQLIDQGSFAGITLTDEIDKFVEFAVAPTRQYTGASVAGVGGSISYSAKFLVVLTLDFDRVTRTYEAIATLTELAKLI